jgi:hypothetical protein
MTVLLQRKNRRSLDEFDATCQSQTENVQLSQAPGINISIHDDETDDDIGK